MKILFDMGLLYNIFFNIYLIHFCKLLNVSLNEYFDLYPQGPLSSLQGMDAGTLKSAMVRNDMLIF